jgi:Tol biopolymer transport system component/DNA-binding winged helix-turn-helix (wHTH) protein
VRDFSSYEFGDIRVDLGRMGVRRGEAPIPLEPKAFDVLVHLIEHRDRLVTKEELLDAVWAGTFVTPNVLTRAVAQIRKALGDESQDARYIETVAKRGYRFIAPVTVVPPREVPPREVPRPESPEPVVAPALVPARDLRRRWMLAGALAVVSLGLIGAFALSGRSAAKPELTSAPADLQPRRLTNRRGYTGAPALSPDARSMVYSSDATGALELYLVSLAPGSAEVALTKDGGHNMQPAWSPDGQWIAFHSALRGGVWIVPSSGGLARQVADFGSHPAWSPDSTTIAFSSDAGGLAGQSSLWTVRRDGSDRRPLTQVGKPAGGHRAPAWSHDGRHIVFVVTRGGWQIDVQTVNLATGAQRYIATSTNTADPIFAPDDRSLLWGGTTATGNGRIFRQAIDDEAGPIGGVETLAPMEGGVVEGLSLGANGTLVFAVRNFDANLWATDVGPDGRGSEPVRLTDDVSRNTHPDYSRDGRVAYMQTAIGAQPSVWIMREDGTERAPLTAGIFAANPQWGPTASRLMVLGGPPEDPTKHELLWLDLASKRTTPVGIPSAGINVPRLSPDGRTLAFHRIEKDGVLRVWTSTLEGAQTLIATDREAVSYPAWSPDGRSLAVEVKRADSTHIGWVPATGGPIVELTTGRGQSWPHSWAPDNDRIAFAGQRDGVWNVYTVSRRTRAVTQVTFFKSAAGYVRYPAWSPIGTRVVFERAVETANVWMVTLPIER